MYHLRFKGQPEEIGYRWGARLKKLGIAMLDNVPFTVDEKRLSFAQKCLPIYQEYYPEAVAEIQGIAQGQQIQPEQLQAVLFGMFSIMPEATHCSSFLVKNAHGLFLGRNSDFLTNIEKLSLNTIYTLPSCYDFSGNTTAFVEMEDGVNQHGLALALTSVAPQKIQPGVNIGFLLRKILEECRTVAQALGLLEKVPRSCSGTLVIGSVQEEGALVEFTPECLTVKTLTGEGYLCATNMFNTTAMQPYNNLPEDTWQAEERYQVMMAYLAGHAGELTVAKAQRLLAGDFGFMCQYDRATGKDTVWSTVYDLTRKKVYRAEGNPGRKKFKEDRRFLFN